MKDIEKDSILASVTEVPLEVLKKTGAGKQAANRQQPAMSQQTNSGELHKWGSPEFVSSGSLGKRATSAML